MKKKTIKVLAVVAVLSAFFIMAAGSGSASEGETREIVEASQEVSAQDASEQDGAGETVVESVPAEEQKTATTIEEQVLLDADGVKITATELVDDSLWGKGVRLLIENNSDKDLGFGCDAVIVNNYMISNLFSSTVTAGNKANETLDLYSTELEAAGIENIGQIELYLHTFDPESYMTITNFDKMTIQTSDYANMDTKAMDDGVELVNQDGIRIVGKYVDENSFWGAGVLLYLENTSGKNVGISCDDMAVNGFMMYPYFSSTVYDGKMAVDEITLLSSELEENGITTIENLELKFRVYDTDSYQTIFETDTINFAVQ